MISRVLCRILFALLVLPASLFSADDLVPFGVAKIDITPDYPIRLTGYASRKTESEGVAQKLWAKAIAIGSDRQGPAILITVDNCGVCANVIEEIASRLKAKIGLPREKLVVASSHTHTGPMITGFAPNIFAQPIPEPQLETIARYTRELTDKIEQAALAALNDRKPARLFWSEGQVGFAANRRTAGGPKDHALPVLCARDAGGKTRAVLANYACHCTTLGGEFNKLCGDWAGFAQEFIEADHPGALALITIGCGADSNPQPRGGPDGGLEWSRKHGQALAAEVNRLLAQAMTALRAPLSCKTERVELPFQKHFTREQWEERAKRPGIVGYHAQRYLARLDRGEPLPATLPYLVQRWNFGEQLALVFLGGEVVVDYVLALKKQFDPARLWVTAYANDVPCYIPSKRILNEGGYEAEDSLWYYDRPQRLAPETEEILLNAVGKLMPEKFRFDEKAAEFPPPKSPQDSLATIRTKAGLIVELVASEPLVVDPVAIDWGPDGRLWVVEMRDFPLGIDGKWKPGGRVKFLEDLNGDGVYERATVFLDEIPFPTGVTAWRKGVLVCAAPDILYAEDTNGDGKADVIKKLFSGFATENYQARVNSLQLGLDNWIYGANGLIGGRIRGLAGDQEINISGRDFRMNLDTGAFEPAAGLTQQGRVRDDFDNWFGCDNSTLLWHYPLPDHYVRRNPHVAPPDPRVNVCADGDPDLNQLFPISRPLRRFNDPHHVNRVTSACGLGIYRDTFLGEAFYGNAFVCEPVHNLVRRLVLEPHGVTFKARRAADEQGSEFLAAKDNWFRPVQVRTGPDGALWIVDFYRFVVEHPRWITPDRLKELDLRAGHDKGRIYRVYPRGKKPRPIRDLHQLTRRGLVDALENSNGTERDRVHSLWLGSREDTKSFGDNLRFGKKIVESAERFSEQAALPHLAGFHSVITNSTEILLLNKMIASPEAGVRRLAIRNAESFLNSAKGVLARFFSEASAKEFHQQLDQLLNSLLRLVADPNRAVCFQLALTLGEWSDPRAGEALGQLAAAHFEDRWMRAAILSSASHFPAPILKQVLGVSSDSRARSEMISGLIRTAIGSNDPASMSEVLIALAPSAQNSDAEVWRMEAVADLLEALAKKNLRLADLQPETDPGRQAVARLQQFLTLCRALPENQQASPAARIAAVRLLGHEIENDADLARLGRVLDRANDVSVQRAAVQVLGRLRAPKIPGLMIGSWSTRSPAIRNQIIETLLDREEWTGDLLSAIENKTVATSEISAAHRQRLLKHAVSSVKERSERLLQTSASGSRAAVVEQFASSLQLRGDVAKGADRFSQLCASCHAFRGQGIAVGPNLAALTDRSGAFLLTAILDPNAAVEDRYVNYTVEMRDGRTLSGIIVNETGTSLTVLSGTGARETVLRADITAMQASNLSLMPEGLEQGLSVQQMADLIAYVQSGPKPFGSATAERAAQAQKDFRGAGPSGMAEVVEASERLPYPGWLGTLPLLHCRQTDGHSRVVWRSAPAPANVSSDAHYSFRLPAALGFLSQPQGKFHLKINGRPALEFDVTLEDRVWASADGAVRMSYTVMENNTEDSNGVLVIEVKGSWLKPGQSAQFEVLGSGSGSQRWFGIYLLPTQG